MSTPTVPVDPPCHLTLGDGTLVHVTATTGELTEWWATGQWLAYAVDIVPDALQRLEDGTDEFDLPQAASVAIESAQLITGREWPVIWRLTGTLLQNWALTETWAVRNAPGIDLLTAPPRQVLAVVHASLLAGCEKENEVTRLEFKLSNPAGVPGMTERELTKPGSKFSPQAEADAARALMAEFGAFRAGGS